MDQIRLNTTWNTPSPSPASPAARPASDQRPAPVGFAPNGASALRAYGIGVAPVRLAPAREADSVELSAEALTPRIAPKGDLSAARELVAARVPSQGPLGVRFDDATTQARPAAAPAAALRMYSQPAQANIAATGVMAGRLPGMTLDVQG